MRKKKLSLKENRKYRVRRKLKNKGVLPRLTVFRSNRNMYAQIIDDAKGLTLVYIKTAEGEKTLGKKTESAFTLGKLLAEKAKKKKITHVIFDRGSYAYHGRVKALADGAREGGLQF